LAFPVSDLLAACVAVWATEVVVPAATAAAELLRGAWWAATVGFVDAARPDF
jgi:hypothetical protein